MPKYYVEGSDTADTTLGSLTTRNPASGRRHAIYDLIFGSEATPADNAFLWVVDRRTATSTGTTTTPEPLDTADIASTTTASDNLTTNPTLGNRVLTCPLNQRATFRWVASPGSNLIAAVTQEVGFIVRTPTSSAVLVTAGLWFEE